MESLPVSAPNAMIPVGGEFVHEGAVFLGTGETPQEVKAVLACAEAHPQLLTVNQAVVVANQGSGRLTHGGIRDINSPASLRSARELFRNHQAPDTSILPEKFRSLQQLSIQQRLRKSSDKNHPVFHYPAILQDFECSFL